MRHARDLRRVCGVILAGWSVCSVGCTHNHYYGNAVPVCGPVTTVPGAVASGSVCEVPSQTGNAAILSSTPSRSTIVSSAPFYPGSGAPRVVESVPSGGTRFGTWRRANPETSVATTSVEGSMNADTTTR